MSFEEALKSVINKYGYDMLKDTFRTYSLISDYVGASFYDSRLAKLFELIYYSFNLYDLFTSKGLKGGRAFLETKYENYNDYSKREYVDCINALAKLVCVDEYKEKKKTKKTGEIVKIKKDSKKGLVLTKTKEAQTKSKIGSEKLKLKNIDSINLKANCKKIYFNYVDTYNSLCIDGKRVYVERKEVYTVKKNLIINSHKCDEIVINIKRGKPLKNLVIDASNADFETNLSLDNESYLDNVYITAKTITNHSISAKNARFSTKSGNIYTMCDFEKISFKTESGFISATLSIDRNKITNLNDNLKIEAKSISGYIYIGLFCMKIGTKLISKAIKGDFTGTVPIKHYYSCLNLDLDVQSIYGSVIVKKA
ncbi:MAG: hypothetical protein K5765_01200 [Clostridia bacterium]|nr:hypothetical protein [Clostridia bacterium]